ncbi:MAG: 5-formyltetrahydrofolate cyclo-ligase [Bdellovibrionales bacterium]|nr:5-formyltetrahydrofolate cyclo-ligase [Bdellovibrionales bacterium]
MKNFIEKVSKSTSDLRLFYQKKIEKLSYLEKKEKSKKINQFILTLPFLKQSSFIGVYKALKREPCLFDFYSQYNQRICFPVMQKTDLKFYTNPQNQWYKKKFQVEEPLPLKKNEIPLQDISLFFIPGSLFDRLGNRIGKGIGYYDKTLSKIKLQTSPLKNTFVFNKKPLFIGVAFVEQIQNDPISTKAHDIQMDLIITDQFILYPFKSTKEL